MTAAKDDGDIRDRLQSLRAEYEALRTRQIENQQDLKNAQAQLAKLQAQAEAEYGTSDREQLEALLQRQRADNARKVEAYASHIEELKSKLAAIDREAQEGD